MREITFRPLNGQNETAIIGIAFLAGETIVFGDGSNDFTDDEAEAVLTNPNFVDAELGRNPNFTCACGAAIEAFVFDPALGHVRTEAKECAACAAGEAPADQPPGAMPAELAAALDDQGDANTAPLEPEPDDAHTSTP